MRKFTKEISALLASITVSAGVCAGTSAEAPQQVERTAGAAAITDDIADDIRIAGEAEPADTIDPTELPREAGVMMTEAPTETIPPLAGDVMISPTTEYDMPPLAGDPLPPDELISTQPTDEEYPPVAGVPLPPDDTESATLIGDADLNNTVDLADLTTMSKHILNKAAFPLKNKVAEANADMNRDGVVDGLDTSALIEKQLGK